MKLDNATVENRERNLVDLLDAAQQVTSFEMNGDRHLETEKTYIKTPDN